MLLSFLLCLGCSTTPKYVYYNGTGISNVGNSVTDITTTVDDLTNSHNDSIGTAENLRTELEQLERELANTAITEDYINAIFTAIRERPYSTY